MKLIRVSNIIINFSKGKYDVEYKKMDYLKPSLIFWVFWWLFINLEKINIYFKSSLNIYSPVRRE